MILISSLLRLKDFNKKCNFLIYNKLHFNYLQAFDSLYIVKNIF